MKEIALYFLKIGLLGFGGPLAHIAMMEQELVDKRKWCTQDQFMEGLAIANVLPGPASTQLGIYLGTLRKGTLGGIVAGICFIFPAFVIITALSALYFQYGTIPTIEGALYGVSAMVIALIAHSMWKMSKKSVKTPVAFFIFVVATLLVALFNVNIFVVMLIGGLLQWASTKRFSSTKHYSFAWPLFPLALSLVQFFLYVGSFIYGGGLVIIPFIEQVVVHQLGWMSQSEFLAGIALGQVTPGPVVITAAFIGYKVLGLLGSVLACVAIFLPSFLFILFSVGFVRKIRKNTTVQVVLQGINAAVLGTIFAAWLSLIPSAIVDGWTLLIALGGGIALVKYKVNTLWCVGIAMVLGALLFYLV